MCTLWLQAPAALKRPWQGREDDEPQSGGFLQSNAPIVTRDQPVSEAGVSSRELVLCCTCLSTTAAPMAWLIVSCPCMCMFADDCS